MIMCETKPILTALSLLSVNIVPSINGRSIRVRPRYFDPTMIVVRITVAPNPHSITSPIFILISLVPLLTRQCFHLIRFIDSKRSIDQANMSKPLGIVPEEVSSHRVNLFRQKSSRPRVAQHCFEYSDRFFKSP